MTVFYDRKAQKKEGRPADPDFAFVGCLAVFCILAAAEAQYFCLPFREIKGYAADIERGFEVKNSASTKRVTKKYGFPIYFYRQVCYNY